MASKTEERTLQVAERFASMMIERMEALAAEEWRQPWLPAARCPGAMPQNITGRNYSGANSFFLELHSALNGFMAPLYMTFQQAHNVGAKVSKGAKSWPVVYWDVVRLDGDGKKVPEEDYRAMSVQERMSVTVIPFIKTYPVFNVDQTDLKQTNPAKYEALMSRFKQPKAGMDTVGMYADAPLDRLVEKNEWVCPIRTSSSRIAYAYYSKAHDEVVLPAKRLYKVSGTPDGVYRDGMQYYTDMLHEMTHSTLTPERLNRKAGSKYGDPLYAKEELVAEMTAAMVGAAMGFDKRIRDNSAKYINFWIKTLKEDPKFILSVMSDVNKAAEMITAAIDRQRLALGQPALVVKHSEDAARQQMQTKMLKNKDGDFMLCVACGDFRTEPRPISAEAAKMYLRLADKDERAQYMSMLADKTFGKDIDTLVSKASKTLSTSKCSI